MNIKRPGFFNTLDIIGTQEMKHFLQFYEKGRSHKYDYHNHRKNMIAYGQKEPPVYDFRNIKASSNTSISIWWSKYDVTASPDSVDLILEDLRGKPNLFTYCLFSIFKS